jgi:hypothetical protein
MEPGSVPCFSKKNKRAAANSGTHETWHTNSELQMCSTGTGLVPCVNKEIIISQIIPAASVSWD